MTLIQAAEELVDNVSVTDRQEETINGSLSNLKENLADDENNLHVEETIDSGSYNRDTNIRPLDDVDTFAVLNRKEWSDFFGNLPVPQNVLTKFKNYLTDLPEYKDKVSQDRPCVTVELSKIDFDVLPAFSMAGGGYLIPNHTLTGWTTTYPESLSANLNSINSLRNYKVKPSIKAIKYWNRENGKVIPSYHIEEVAISIFQSFYFNNYKESIKHWFDNAEYYLESTKFDSIEDYNKVITSIKSVKEKLREAEECYQNDDEDEAIHIWKEVFGREFPTVTEEEAKIFSRSLSEGSLKVSPTGTLSLNSGVNIIASKGFYGDIK